MKQLDGIKKGMSSSIQEEWPTWDDIKWLVTQVENYRKEIVNLRGKAHLSCPNCYEDCIGWVSDGEPCGDTW
jgi:hypothetical protein